MANHVIYDRLWESGKLARCSREAALAYPWIFLVADDHGRFEYRPARIWAKVFGGRQDITADDVASWLAEYAREGLLVRYHIDGDLAYWYRFKGRKPSERRPSDFPDPKGMPSLAAVAPEGAEKRGSEGDEARDEPRQIDARGRAEVEQIRAERETEQTGAVSLGVPEAERPAYADAVWSEFIRVSASKPTRVMAPGEWTVLKGWMDTGVPLMLVLRGITDTRGRGSSLGYYGPGVKAAIELWRKAVA